MPLSPTSGGQITVSEAQDLIRAFQAMFPEEIKASFIGTDNINLILNQENCIGIRTYYGYDEEQKRLSLIMVGVDQEEKDMTSGYIMDKMMPCPTNCDPSSPLYL